MKFIVQIRKLNRLTCLVLSLSLVMAPLHGVEARTSSAKEATRLVRHAPLSQSKVGQSKVGQSKLNQSHLMPPSKLSLRDLLLENGFSLGGLIHKASDAQLESTIEITSQKARTGIKRVHLRAKNQQAIHRKGSPSRALAQEATVVQETRIFQEATLDFLPNGKIQLNGMTLEPNLVSGKNPEELFRRIQTILHHTAPTSANAGPSREVPGDLSSGFEKVNSLWSLLGALVLGDRAQADLGWIGFSAIVIAAGALAFGGYLLTKNLKNTKHKHTHEVTVKVPEKFTVDANVGHNVTANATLNANGSLDLNGDLTGNLTAQGLPENLNLAVDIPINFRNGGQQQ